MQVRIVTDAPASLRAEALVVPVFSEAALEGAAKGLDGDVDGAIGELLSSGEIKGKSYETALVRAPKKPYTRILVVGLGDAAKFEPYMLARYAGTAVRYLGRRNLKDIAIALPPQAKGNEAACAAFVAEGAIAATLDTTMYQAEPEKTINVASVTISADGFDAKALEGGAARGTAIGEAVNTARRMALTPANHMTPSDMASRAEEIGREVGIKVDVLDEGQMEREGMGSLLGVSRGSDEPAKLIVMTYKGDPSSTEVLALIGKGLTFDSGGISIKPAENMHEMKYDMSGGAGVIAAMSAIGKLKPSINVIGVVPASENLPGPRAMKPGDILRAMNGKTIEVINTDAEGRLILADALCYAKKLGATKIIDAATLTGACVVALGHAASAAIGNNDEFVQYFLRTVKPTGERYWQMPLFEDYTTAVKSEIADLKNSAGRAAGSLTAAAFLKAFVGETPWIHLDVAGTAYLDTESAWQAKGPTGTPVRAFVAMTEALAKNDFKPATPAPNGAKAKATAASSS
ncbi:MAG: leucyl aminopeptidase [Candidatus Eremiobacteraeota bacterium]|nr:leucyl aminopeptidase [Candidatus Eremiobacteraeota bacterium]